MFLLSTDIQKRMSVLFIFNLIQILIIFIKSETRKSSKFEYVVKEKVQTSV